MVAVRHDAGGAARTLCGTLRLLTAGGLLVLAGCATSSQTDLVAFLRAHDVEVAGGEYIVRPPDQIAIHSPIAPEIDGTTQRIRSDGKIVLRLLGEVEVAGLTPPEIARKLEAQLARYYRTPEVVVEVVGYHSQFYYVFGEVAAPGPRPFTGRDTLLHALADAGPTYLAWRSQIHVTRPAADESRPETIVVDLDQMIRRGDTSENILLQEGDIINVPPTPLAWLGHRVRELLYPMSPAIQAYTTPASTISATHEYEDTTGGESSGDRSRRSNLIP